MADPGTIAKLRSKNAEASGGGGGARGSSIVVNDENRELEGGGEVRNEIKHETFF